MNINMVKKALPYLFEAGITPMITGIQGVGKSTGVKEYAEENDLEFVDLRLGSMDVGDLLGLPDFKTDEEGNKTSTAFMQPDWFPADPDSKGIIFLDEINRARRDVLQAVFQLVLDRKMHDKPLPQGWYVVAACNPDSEDFTVTDMSDKALMDRFCHIKVTSSYQDFIEYGKTKKFDSKVLNFISAQPTMLRGNNKDFDLSYVQPSDRSWHLVSKLTSLNIKDVVLLNELIQGLVGTEASTAFIAHMEKQEKPVAGKDVVMNYNAVKAAIVSQSSLENYRSDMVNETANSVLEHLNEVKGIISEEEYANLIAFSLDVPNDVLFPFLRKWVHYKDIFMKMKDEKSLLDKLTGYKPPASLENKSA